MVLLVDIILQAIKGRSFRNTSTVANTYIRFTDKKYCLIRGGGNYKNKPFL